MNEWVEVEGKSIDTAIELAMAELGIESREQARVEVLQEAKPGFLGLGAQSAVVKVSRKPNPSRRRRRRKKGKAQASSEEGQRNEDKGKRPQKSRQKSGGSGNNGPKRAGRSPKREESSVIAPETNIEDQAALAKEFLEGLLAAFGLDGAVATRVEDDVLYMDVTGDQTEALVGQKGTILQAIHELTRTVIQRRTYRAPRMRLDINGYTERRRAALRIFASQIAEQALETGDEVMLEPMNPADRKVLHDAVAEIDGVRSFSEGEEPRRSVVIAPTGDSSKGSDDEE